jgi:site-specific DNA recombinase
MTRAVLYCRVSTDDQAEGYSLEGQEATPRAYCKRHGIEVAKLFMADHSAKTFDRPVFKDDLLPFIRGGSADLLLVSRGAGWEMGVTPINWLPNGTGRIWKACSSSG